MLVNLEKQMDMLATDYEGMRQMRDTSVVEDKQIVGCETQTNL